jgi:hypothetical protein
VPALRTAVRVTPIDQLEPFLLAPLIFFDFLPRKEDSSDLQKPEQATVKAQIVRLAGEAMSESLPLSLRTAVRVTPIDQLEPFLLAPLIFFDFLPRSFFLSSAAGSTPSASA